MLHRVHQHFRSIKSCITHPISVPSLSWLTVHTAAHLWGQINQNLLGLMDYQGSVTSYYYLSLLIVDMAVMKQHHFLHFPEGQYKKGDGIYPVQHQTFISSKSGCLKQFRWTKSSSAHLSPINRGRFRMISWDAVIWS